MAKNQRSPAPSQSLLAFPAARCLEMATTAQSKPTTPAAANGQTGVTMVADGAVSHAEICVVRIPVDLGGCSGVIRALVPVDLGAVGAKRRALSGVGAKRRVKAHAEG